MKANKPLRERVAQLETELKESIDKQLELTKKQGANEEKLRQVTESTNKWKKERNNAIKKANETVSKYKQMQEEYRLKQEAGA
jgi:predicted  nucleic acid-binding Zn-ribbon protein